MNPHGAAGSDPGSAGSPLYWVAGGMVERGRQAR